MQKITREILIEKAVSLLENGTVNAVLGWKKGEFGYDITPAMFRSKDELRSDFAFGSFCGTEKDRSNNRVP